VSKLTLILVVLCLTLASTCLSAPNIVMYRYQGGGFILDDAHIRFYPYYDELRKSK